MEGRVNWRRILAGILSAGLLGLCALLLPSLHRTTHPSSQSLPPAAPVPENVNSSAGSEPPILPSPVVAATAASRLPLPQSNSSAVPDIDPHKAFGSKTAPVTMEVYSDFQCPACKQLFKTTNQLLTDNYVNTGKVYLIHRDFPLPMHAYSRVAASYARAAAHIGKCEPVEKALFQNQEKWEANGDVKGIVAGVLSPAEMKRVQAIVDAKTLEPMIEKDKQLGQTLPVTQTPTSVFHSKGQTYPFAGTLSYDVLKDFLDQLVAQK